MIKKCNKTKCDFFSWTAISHCRYNLIEYCNNKNIKNVNKSNQSSPDTKGTDKV